MSPTQFRVKKFIGSTKFYARKGLTGITGNIYTGLHEFTDMGFLLHFLRPEDIFFDVGANVGSYSLLASGICKATTIALEPSTIASSVLQKNVALNKLDSKVSVIAAAAGAYSSVSAFTKNEDTTNHMLTNEELKHGDVETVNVITIDSLSFEQKPSLIKIDVEGFETEVIKGMADTLKQITLKAIIIELNGSGGRYGFDENAIHLLLLTNNFKPCSYNPFKRELNVLEGHGNYNTIYCRDIDFVNTRLTSAASFKIMGEFI
ncbi:FkbM family methyltransferase [Inquilinus sp. KBS0705]|nr:FkbM family methyltransferase [Inquilinus sp. KBS0705]